MFGRVFAGEFKKLIRPRGLIILAVLFVVLFIFFAVIYNINIEAMLGSINDILIENGEEGIFEQGKYFDEDGNEITAREYGELYGYINLDYIALADAENVDKIIAEVTEYYEYFKSENKKHAFDSQISSTKSCLAMLKYMKENNVYGADVKIEGYRDYFGLQNAENFVETYFSVVLAILIIYGIVISAGSHSGGPASF